MASARDWAHMRAIAEGKAQARWASIRDTAFRSPAQNLTAACELSAWISSFAGTLDRPAEPPLIALWRARRRQRRRRRR